MDRTSTPVDRAQFDAPARPVGAPEPGGSARPVGGPAGAQTSPRLVRRIDDVETLKALSDPTRMAILRALMYDMRVPPRVMSVKELAEELDEPQTKLYRHIRNLEAAALIEVAQTRLVSGIVEQRYRAAQYHIEFDNGLFTRVSSQDTSALIAAGFDSTRDEVLALIQARRLVPGQPPLAEAPDLRPYFVHLLNRVSVDRAVQFRARLAELVEELSGDAVEGGVALTFFAACYTQPDP